jgi:hypothetical protein
MTNDQRFIGINLHFLFGSVARWRLTSEISVGSFEGLGITAEFDCKTVSLPLLLFCRGFINDFPTYIAQFVVQGFLLIDAEGVLGRQHRGAYDIYTSTLTHEIGRSDVVRPCPPFPRQPAQSNSTTSHTPRAHQ